MTRIPKWTWLVTTALLVAFAGCADDDDDGGGGGGVTVDGNDDGGDGGDNNDEASGEARGSPGWGLIGSIGAVLAVGYIVRRKMK